MRLVEPKKSGFNSIGSYRKPKKAISEPDAKQTIRFKADGTVTVQVITSELSYMSAISAVTSYLHITQLLSGEKN